jgi:hypothetical protein
MPSTSWRPQASWPPNTATPRAASSAASPTHVLG